MKSFVLIPVALLCMLLLFKNAVAQETKKTYDYKKVFDPLFFTHNGNGYRSANGAPGPKYWQNKADYIIHAALNESDTSLNGDVLINYTNSSPDTLNYLWLQLDQNLFAPGSRGSASLPVSGSRFDAKGYKKGGYTIQSATVLYKGKNYTIIPVITDTRMQLRLPFSLQPNGDRVSIKINYSFSIPQYGADRMGRLSTKNGVIYQLAQWYPRVCVYDDVEGWNTLPYIGAGEFYCEYGNFDYFITVPAGFIVTGSGDLQNPGQVLTATQVKRLNEAHKSDSTVHIIYENEVGTSSSRPVQNSSMTWHFKMHNSRDISWSASKAFMWDAARINFPSGRKGIAMAVYPVESNTPDAYRRGTQYLKQSIEFYSKNYYEYPWNAAVLVAGVALGMEYPGIVFCSYSIVKDDLWHDVTHETGHNWFPMIVGSNERRYTWMDEGMCTFINGYASNWFNNGEYADSSSQGIISMTGAMKKSKDPLMMAPESMKEGGMYYYKTAAGLKILRNNILGADRFDYAFKTYIKRWAFRHPQPDDFFRTMNDAAGENLNWFWKLWFFETWNLDQSVKNVKYKNDSPQNGAFITIENLGEMALPVSIKITEANGQLHEFNLPVEIWQQNSEFTFGCNTVSAITSVVIDPNIQLPDIDRTNNTWKPVQ